MSLVRPPARFGSCDPLRDVRRGGTGRPPLANQYFFRSYEPGKEDRVVMVVNVLPGEEPSAGPNYYNFDPNVRYAFNVDSNRDGKANDVVISFDFKEREPLAEDLIAVPSNVGPRTMPDYDALAAQGIYDLGNGIRVFAGQRNDRFAIDLGATFDSLNLRRFPPLLTRART